MAHRLWLTANANRIVGFIVVPMTVVGYERPQFCRHFLDRRLSLCWPAPDDHKVIQMLLEVVALLLIGRDQQDPVGLVLEEMELSALTCTADDLLEQVPQQAFWRASSYTRISI